MSEPHSPGLHRHFGLLHAVALNVTQIVGAGVFVTVPLMLLKLPGPYAILGWLAAGALMILDGTVWAELGAAMPGSGGSYVYLLECYGPKKWGRAAAFLFIWQFLISGPLEIASGLIAIATFASSLSPAFGEWNAAHRLSKSVDLGSELTLGLTLDPSRVLGLALGVAILVLLYQRITAIGKLTVLFWAGVLAAIAWVLIEGAARFDPNVAFDFSGAAAQTPDNFWVNLGRAAVLAMYSYLGYYNVCYIGDEVRDPGRTIPRAILLSALLVAVLFVGLHLAMLGVVPWTEIPSSEKALEDFSLPAEFMKRVHGEWAASAITVLLIWCCFGSAFAGLLGYARIPYGAARRGHFFAALAKVHPVHRIPHVSLLLVGGLMLFWSLFDLASVINALIVTRILEQFVAQCIGVMVLRKTRPDLPRPYRIWLYPVPCLLALVGWLGMYASSGAAFILLGLATLSAGVVVFLAWAYRSRTWPFELG